MDRLPDQLPQFGDVVDDPNEMHAVLRAHCPVHKISAASDGHAIYLLSRHDDIFTALRDQATWSNSSGNFPEFVEQRGLRGDPPESDIFRRLVVKVFNARRIKSLTEHAVATCHRTIDGFIADGTAEISAQYASLLPMELMCELLGVDKHRQEDFKRWMDEWLGSLETEDAEGEEQARLKTWDYFRQKFAQRRRELSAHPEDAPIDALGVFVSAMHPEGRPFTDDELLPLTLNLLSGGADTTKYLITACVYRLLEQPELWRQVSADPELVEVAVEETLRFDSPVTGVYRTNHADATVRGQLIPAHSKMQCLLAAANRDDAVFDHPNEFRLDRDRRHLRNNHLALGSGSHFCVGAALGRMGAKTAVQVLCERLPDLRLADKPIAVKPYVMPNSIPRGVTELHVEWPLPITASSRRGEFV